jgi:hypothetical protein
MSNRNLSIECAVAYVTVTCDDCGAQWDEDMHELGCGYTLAFAWDKPAYCPECPEEEDDE